MRLVQILETGTIRSRLTGALVLLASIPVLVLVVSLYLLGRMSGDARRIEFAASLRMGTFVVAARLEHYLSNPDLTDVSVVDQELARMEEAIGALETGSRALRIAPVRDAASRACVSETRAALAAYREIVLRVAREVGAGDSAPDTRNRRGAEILAA